jgi:hypothetical protein
MIRKYDGSLLSDSEKVMVAARVRPTVHALNRIKERCPNLHITKSIVDSPLVYWNQNGYIVVSLPNNYSMIIDHEYALVTVREASANMYSNADRWLLTRWRATVGRRCY